MKKIKYILATWIIMQLISCVKETNLGSSHYKNAIRSGYFYMTIYQNDRLLADSIMEDANIYYIKDGEKIDYMLLNGFDLAEDSVTLIPAKRKFLYNDSKYFPGLGATEVSNLGMVQSFGAKEQILTWYLEFKNGDIDTLHVVSRFVSDEEGLTYPCQCHNPILSFKYNGAPVELIDNYKGTGVTFYVVNKQ